MPNRRRSGASATLTAAVGDLRSRIINESEAGFERQERLRPALVRQLFANSAAHDAA